METTNRPRLARRSLLALIATLVTLLSLPSSFLPSVHASQSPSSDSSRHPLSTTTMIQTNTHAAQGSLKEAHKAAFSNPHGNGHHEINAHNRAKAAAFVAHLDSLVAGLKAKSHLARLSKKYPAARSAAENATLAHEAAERLRERSEGVLDESVPEEDEFGRTMVRVDGETKLHQREVEQMMHQQEKHAPMHAPAGSPTAHLHAQIHKLSSRQNAKANSAHIPHSEPSPSIAAAVASIHVPDHDLRHHVVLDPVPAKHRTSPHDHETVDADGLRHRRGKFGADANYVIHPIQLAPTSPSPSGLNFTTFVYPTIQGNVTIFVGITEYPLGKFHIYPSPRDEMDEISLVEARSDWKKQRSSKLMSRLHPADSFLELSARLNPLCDGVAMTSVSAQAYNCLLAQNAGFFNMATDGCMGNIISNDQFINHATSDMFQRVHFGLTRKGNYLTGYLTEEEVNSPIDGGFHELTQGNGWLIRDGANYIRTSMQIEKIGVHFVEEKAPRNALGHDKDGRLLMFEADGEEDINLGLTLYEFADILTHHFGVENAVNVDGGGSSTTVYKGEVVDRPTCRDTPQMCERAVTTISCVMP